MAERLDGDVDAAVPGHLHDLRHRVAGLKDDVRAQALRHLLPRRDALDGDDEPGPKQPRAGRGAEAHRALGKDRHRVAEPDLRPLDGGEARRHDVRGEQDLLVLQVVRDAGEGRLGSVDEEVFALCTEHEIARRVVGEAGLMLALHAAGAHAATLQTARHHAVTRLECGHPRAYCDHSARRFVPHRHAGRDGHLVDQVNVAPTDGAEPGLNERLAGAGIIGVGDLGHGDLVLAGLHAGVGNGHGISPLHEAALRRAVV